MIWNGSGSLARLGRRSMPSGLPGRNGHSSGNGNSSGARQETLREANLLLITEEIFAATEPLSRADLSIRTGMTRSTVSRLVDDLLAAGIVREGSPIIGPTRGRPAVPLTPARRTLAGLGVEVNVDFMAARAMDLTGTTLAEEILEGDYRGSDPVEVLQEAGEMALRVATGATEAGAQVVGTVLALPGLVASDARSLLLAPNLGWQGIDVVDLLLAPDEQGQLGAFALVANEAKLAALAVAQELTEADGQEQTFLYVSAQMGIGSAVVIDGVVDPGPHGWAGELGHTPVEPAGPECGCGSTGCLEVYAGKRALLTSAGLEPTANIQELVDLTEWEDDAGRQATEAIERAGWALGVSLSGAMNVLDVHEVVLGGEFGPLTDLLRPGIEEQLETRVLASTWADLRVRESATGIAPATTGGAMRALRSVVDAPQDWVPTA